MVSKMSSSQHQVPRVSLQKVLFYAVQSLQEYRSGSVESLVQSLRELWRVASAGAFRSGRRQVFPPNPRDFVNSREVAYLGELTGQSVESLLKVMQDSVHEASVRAALESDPDRSELDDSSNIADRDAAAAAAVASQAILGMTNHDVDVFFDADASRVQHLVAMLLVTLCCGRTLPWQLIDPTKIPSSAIRAGVRPSAVFTSTPLSRRLYTSVVFSHGNCDEIKAHLIAAVVSATRMQQRRTRVADEGPKMSPSRMPALISALSRYALSHPKHFPAVWARCRPIESMLASAMQMRFERALAQSSSRKNAWSFVTASLFSPSKATAPPSPTARLSDDGSAKEDDDDCVDVDTILSNIPAIRKELKRRRPRALRRFNNGMRVARVGLSAFRSWLMVEEQQLRAAARNRASQVQSHVGGRAAQGAINSSKASGSRSVPAPPAAKTPRPSKTQSLLTQNQQSVFRRFSAHLHSQSMSSEQRGDRAHAGTPGRGSGASTSNAPIMSAELENAAANYCLGLVSQAAAAVRAETKAAEGRRALWRSLASPFIGSSERSTVTLEFRSAVAVSAIELLTLHCDVSPARARPLRVAHRLQALARALTQALTTLNNDGKGVAAAQRGAGGRVGHLGAIALATISFFVRHPSATHDVRPLVTAFFSQCLSRAYKNPILAYSTVQFCVTHRKAPVVQTSIGLFFPLLFKILAVFPTTFVDEFKILVRFLAVDINDQSGGSNGLVSELLHTVLDLPLLAGAVAFHGRLTSGHEEWFKVRLGSDAGARDAYQYLLRNESKAFRRPPGSRMAQCAAWFARKDGDEGPQLSLVTTLLDVFFTHAALSHASIGECEAIVSASIDRFDARGAATWQLGDRVLAILTKYPTLLDRARSRIIQTLATSKQGGPLCVRLIWAIGEYVQTKRLPVHVDIVRAYLQALERVVGAQIATLDRVEKDSTASREKDEQIAPPSLLAGLLNRDEKSTQPNTRPALPKAEQMKRIPVRAEARVATQLINVTMTAMCKLAARCVGIVPAVRSTLIRVLNSRAATHPSVSLRAHQCARLLHHPGIALALYEDPFDGRDVVIDENTSVELMASAKVRW